MLQKILAFALLLLLALPAQAQPADAAGDAPADPQRYPLVPWPAQIEAQEGAFALTRGTRIALSDPQNEELQNIASLFGTLVRTGSVFPVPVSEEAAAGAADSTITFLLTDGADSTPPGRYRLEVTPASVVVAAPTARGLFYGMQTLRQLLPPHVEGGLGAKAAAAAWAIPAVVIEDEPRFGYRGMHLDVARHFFPVSFIKKYIDLLAMYKFNRFHWHLTEDQGWRIEIEQYPRLTEVGACRDSSMVGHYSAQTYDGAEYCGFYSQEEVREIVDYARQRHVTVIPEIEMPGHARAALAAYPELGCTPEALPVATTWGIHEEIFCPKEETFTFLENVLTEVMELFPSEYIHIGGDEAPKDQWEESEVAQAVIEREGLEGEDELQSYFIRRIEAFLNENGRQLIGWDEILEGGLAPEATVMSWRGIEGGIAAARQGHDAIMTPTDFLYFDYYQADPETEPVTIGGYVPLRKVYGYEPIPEVLSEEEAEHILGAQGNVWTEYMKTPQKVEYMLMPRMLALSEVVWSPAAARDWGRFTMRLAPQLRRLDAMGVHYHVPRFLRVSSR